MHSLSIRQGAIPVSEHMSVMSEVQHLSPFELHPVPPQTSPHSALQQ